MLIHNNPSKSHCDGWLIIPCKCHALTVFFTSCLVCPLLFSPIFMANNVSGWLFIQDLKCKPFLWGRNLTVSLSVWIIKPPPQSWLLYVKWCIFFTNPSGVIAHNQWTKPAIWISGSASRVAENFNCPVYGLISQKYFGLTKLIRDALVDAPLNRWALVSTAPEIPPKNMLLLMDFFSQQCILPLLDLLKAPNFLDHVPNGPLNDKYFSKRMLMQQSAAVLSHG